MDKNGFLKEFDNAFVYALGRCLISSKTCKNDSATYLIEDEENNKYYVTVTPSDSNDFKIRVYRDKLERKDKIAENGYPLTKSNVDPSIAWAFDWMGI